MTSGQPVGGVDAERRARGALRNQALNHAGNMVGAGLSGLLGCRFGFAAVFWLVLLITFVVLPIRAVVAASIVTGWGVLPVQILDGIGAGLQSVAVPGMVARQLAGTGRVNAGQGAVMTVQGAGAAFSPLIGGFLAQELGYRPAFLVLGAFPVVSLLIWLVFAPMLPARTWSALGLAPGASAPVARGRQ